MALHKQTAIGSILPDVNIKKMVVNDANDYHLIQRYPHILHPTENQPSPGSTGVSVALMLYIRDTISHATKEYLFNSLELEKYLMIRVHQFADARDNSGQSLSAAAMKADLNLLDATGAQTYLAALASGDGAYGYSSSDLMVSDVLKKKNLFKLSRSDGNYFDIPFEVTMESLNGNPENLFFIVQTTLNFEDIAADYDIFNIHLDSIQNMAGNLNFGIVYENGSIKRTTNIFYTPSGKVWSGQIHYAETSGYMAGANHGSITTSEDVPPADAHFPLIKSTVRNLKIQDMRKANQIDSFLPSFLYDFNKNLQDPLSIKLLSQDPVKSLNYNSANEALDSNGYVSEPLITHDVGANPRIFFTLDMLQIARDNFQYGGLLSRCQADGSLSPIRFESSIFKNNFIRQIQIVRQKVREGKPENEPEEIIATATRTESGDLVSNFDNFWNAAAMLDEDERKQVARVYLALLIKGSHPIPVAAASTPTGAARAKLGDDAGTLTDITTSLSLHGSNKKLRSFMFTDLTAKNSPGSSFSYKIKLVLNDGTIDAVRELLSAAQEKRVLIEEYLSKTLIPGMYDHENRSLTGAFAQTHAPASSAAMFSSEGVGSVFKQMLRFLAAALPEANTILFSNENFVVSENVFEALLSYISPVSATPDSIRSFLEFYDKIYTTIASATNMKNVSRNSAIDGVTPGMKVATSNGAKDLIEIEIRLKKANSNSLTYSPAQQDLALFKQPLREDISLSMFGGPTGATRASEGLQGAPPGLGAAHKKFSYAAGTKNESRNIKYFKTVTAEQLTMRNDFEIKIYFTAGNATYAFAPNAAASPIQKFHSVLKYSPLGTSEGTNSPAANKYYLTPASIGPYESTDDMWYSTPAETKTSRTKMHVGNLDHEFTPTKAARRDMEIKIRFIQMLMHGFADSESLGADFPEAFGNHAQGRRHARMNLGYIISKAALALGMNPNEDVLGAIAALFNSEIHRESFLSDIPTGDDAPTLEDNVAAQFLSEGGLPGDPTFADNFGNKINYGSQKIDAFVYLVICRLIRELFPGQKVPTYGISDGTGLRNGIGNLLDGIGSPLDVQGGTGDHQTQDGRGAQHTVQDKQEIALVDQYWKNLPLQIKYLNYSEHNLSDGSSGLLDHFLRDGRKIYDPENIFNFLKITSIYKIQYLSGYKTSITDKTFSLKEAVFEDMTPATTLQLAGKTLICRFKRYINSDYCFNLENAARTIITDKYFMLEIPGDYVLPSEEPAVTPTNAAGAEGNDNAPPAAGEVIDPVTGGYTS